MTTSNVIPWVPRTVHLAQKTLHDPYARPLEIRLALSVIIIEVEAPTASWAPHVARRLRAHARRLGPVVVPVLADRRAGDRQLEFVAGILAGAPELVPDVLVAVLAERAPRVSPKIILELAAWGMLGRPSGIFEMITAHWRTSGDPILASAAIFLMTRP